MKGLSREDLIRALAARNKALIALLESSRQSTNSQNDRRLVVIVTQFRISRRRKRDNADFARCEPLRCAACALRRFAGNRRIALQVSSLARHKRLHEVDRFSRHGTFVGTAIGAQSRLDVAERGANPSIVTVRAIPCNSYLIRHQGLVATGRTFA